MNDQLIKLILDLADSPEQAKRLADALRSVDTSGKAAAQSSNQLEYELDGLMNTYELLVPDIKNEIDWTEKSIETNTRATQSLKSLSSAKQQVSKSGMQLQQSLGQVGYAIGDFTSSTGSLGNRLRGVANNIQMVATSFGPWGIAVGIATSVGIALLENWDNLFGASEKLTKSTDEQTEAFERQISVLDRRAKAFQASVDKQRDAIPKEQKERGSSFEEAVTEAGGIDALIRKALPTFMARQLRAGAPPNTEEGFRKQLEQLFGQAGTGSKGARESIRSLLIGSGQTDAALAIDKTSPEGRAQTKAKETDKKLSEQLNKQGQDNEEYTQKLVEKLDKDSKKSDEFWADSEARVMADIDRENAAAQAAEDAIAIFTEMDRLERVYAQSQRGQMEAMQQFLMNQGRRARDMERMQRMMFDGAEMMQQNMGWGP